MAQESERNAKEAFPSGHCPEMSNSQRDQTGTDDTKADDKQSRVATDMSGESNGAKVHEESTRMDSTDTDSQLDETTDGDIAAQAVNSQLHRRNESLPPQKYEVEAETYRNLKNSMSPQPMIEEETDISLGGHDMSIGSSSNGMFRETPRTNHIDSVDLHFVDVMLSGSQLDPGHPLSGSLKSAEQIRTDSFSSQAPPKSPTHDTDHSHVYLARSESHQSNASESLRVESCEHSFNSTSAGADDSRVSIGSIPGDKKPLEGRYRGRVSRSSSRATSPGLEPGTQSRRASSSHDPNTFSMPQTAVSKPVQPIEFLRPAPMLVAADEDGNISISQDVPVSPRTISAPLSTLEHPHAQQSNAQDEKESLSGQPTKEENREVILEDDRRKRSANAATDTDAEAALAKDAGLSDKADQVQTSGKTRRKSSSATAPDSLESRTRMTTLPAKSKAEEIKHREDFAKMMVLAKEMEKKRAEEDAERKRRKQDEQRLSLGQWEKEILPSWTRARKDESLAELWWKGAPPSIRGRVWALAIGNPLMLPRNLLDQTEKRACSNGDSIETIIPPYILDAIDDDVQDTLPSLKLFQESGPLHDDLLRICKAFVLVRMEQVSDLDSAGDANKGALKPQSTSTRGETEPLAGPASLASDERHKVETTADQYAQRGIEIYQRGLAALAAILLINLPVTTAFISLLNLIHSKAWLKALYSLQPTNSPEQLQPASQSDKVLPPRGHAYILAPKEKSIRGFERVLETLLADAMPKAYANLLAHNVKLYRLVLRDWVGQLFGKHLDIDTVMRLWDVILLDETDSLIYRTCLALVQTLESRLYVPDQEELESVLQGTNKAALNIWRREKEPTGELMLHVPTSPRRPSRTSFSSNGLRSPTATTISAELNKETIVSPASSRTSDLQLNHYGMPESDVLPKDYIYEQYGIKEDNIFDTLQEQKHSWKQSTLQRLLQRELGD